MKVRITQGQLKLIVENISNAKSLNEDDAKTLLNKSRSGDELRMKSGVNDLTFEVQTSSGGKVIVKNTNTGSALSNNLFYLDPESLKDAPIASDRPDRLKGVSFAVKTVHIPKAAANGEDVLNPDTWKKKHTFNDVRDVEVVRGGSVVSTLTGTRQGQIEKGMEDTEMSPKELMDIIMKDPTLKSAFYDQPKLLGFIKSGDPKGIIAASKVIDKYEDSGSALSSDVNSKFTNNISTKFKLVEPVSILLRGGTTMQLEKDMEYLGKVKKTGKKIQIIYKKVGQGSSIGFTLIRDKGSNKLEVKYGELDGEGEIVDSKKGVISIANYNVDAVR